MTSRRHQMSHTKHIIFVSVLGCSESSSNSALKRKQRETTEISIWLIGVQYIYLNTCITSLASQDIFESEETQLILILKLHKINILIKLKSYEPNDSNIQKVLISKTTSDFVIWTLQFIISVIPYSCTIWAHWMTYLISRHLDIIWHMRFAPS